MRPSPHRSAVATTLLALAGASGPALALDVAIPSLGIEGTLNNVVTVGAQLRTEDRSEDLVGKHNLDTGGCAGIYQSCQGLFKGQIYPSERLVNLPGAPSMRADNGNLNYDQYDLTQGGVRLTQDLTFSKGDFGFFARTIAYYDAVNDQRKDYYPSLITRENMGRVGITGDSNASNRYFSRTYGPGAETEIRRTDSTLRRQMVADVQVLDFNFFGKLPIPFTDDRQLSFKIGRQNVNWGESTLLVINSINQASPVNANNLNRFGFQVEEVFRPVGMAFASFEPYENGTIEAFYQLEWQPVEIPAPGSFMSSNDIGTDNLTDFVNLSFGGSADDLDKTGFFLDNPLSLVTYTTANIGRLPDRDPGSSGQYGVALKTYFEELNGGSELGLYFMNYHSRLPYVSFNAGQASCARAEGNTLGINAVNTLQLLQTCPRLPVAVVQSAQTAFLADIVPYALTHPGIINDLGGDPTLLLGLLNPADGDTSNLDSLVQLDSGPFFLEYPKDIQLFGMSFNTTAGEYSFQGEVAYRPNLPLQVSVIDVAFAAAQPFLTRCGNVDPNNPSAGVVNCAGSQGGGTGFQADGSRGDYTGSDAIDGCSSAAGNCDTVNLILGAAPNSARSFPSFVWAYRGRQPGEAVPGEYIRGYERFDVLQYNLGITRIFGATQNPFGADQIISLVEIGATHVPGLPSLDQLQIDAPGVYYHASAGADGTGADGSRQACVTNPSCVVGADGGRFNPHQADLDDFADAFSWGYRIVNIIKYESILPGISLQPFIIFAHDVNGTAPGPGENFIQGRKSVNANFEVRYKSDISFTAGYNWYWGGGNNNLIHDRDNLQLFARYLF
ncbi:DUF1302 domain-containing protein [Phenylobacterium sp.]|uniref:DUF1302 domain-containing protein n=1 Tax=Phenylobacterium sp. TaxID=1871053 RepID=UPI002737BBC0|nr:DUF1302 family protein [Phenylobacterium sp.]MDP3870855.1 DUF1302 family protein [Phenylobacterium sp.]